MIEPVCRLDQGRTFAAQRIGEPDTIGRSAIADLLLLVHLGKTVAMNGEGLDRIGNVFQLLLTERAIAQCQPFVDLIIGLLGDAYAAGPGDTFQPACDIDAIAENIVPLGNDVAQMNAHAELHLLVRRTGVSRRDLALNFGSAGNSLDNARKFRQQPVSHELDHASAMGAYGRFDQLGAKAPQRRQRAGFILAHHPAVAGDIGCQNRCQAAVHWLLSQAQVIFESAHYT
jgi:hypothetical protein